MTRPSTLPDVRIRTMATELKVIMKQLQRLIREQSDLGELTPSQFSALLRLENKGPMTISDLAKIEGIRSQSMGTIVTALEKTGFIDKRPDPGDGRKTILSLTKSFHQWIAQGREAHTDWLSREIKENLNLDDQARLEQGIGILKQLLNA